MHAGKHKNLFTPHLQNDIYSISIFVFRLKITLALYFLICQIALSKTRVTLTPQTPIDSKLQKLHIRFYQSCILDKRNHITFLPFFCRNIPSAKKPANIGSNMKGERLVDLSLQNSFCMATVKGSFPLLPEFSSNSLFLLVYDHSCSGLRHTNTKRNKSHLYRCSL